MVTGFFHTGFVVEDLERSVSFYRDVVGLEILREREFAGSEISQVLGYESAHLKMAMLGVHGQKGHALELIQYFNPASSGRTTSERSVLGASHLAFHVDDIEGTFQRMIANGARQLNPPVHVPPNRSACYLQDPDGNWIELLQRD